MRRFEPSSDGEYDLERPDQRVRLLGRMRSEMGSGQRRLSAGKEWPSAHQADFSSRSRDELTSFFSEADNSRIAALVASGVMIAAGC